MKHRVYYMRDLIYDVDILCVSRAAAIWV